MRRDFASSKTGRPNKKINYWRHKMKESIFKSYDELPLFFNAEVIGKVLGVSISSAYELMHEKGFPSVRIGNRLIIPKDKFIEWVDKKAEKVG